MPGLGTNTQPAAGVTSGSCIWDRHPGLLLQCHGACGFAKQKHCWGGKEQKSGDSRNSSLPEQQVTASRRTRLAWQLPEHTNLRKEKPSSSRGWFSAGNATGSTGKSWASPGSASRVDAHLSPLMPAQVARVTAVSAPAVTFMTANLMDQAFTGTRKESSRPSCPPALILHADRKSAPVERDGDKDHSFKLVNEDDSSANGNKPVASTPVPGSPWCVVWTGDDRVFFFNPTMQLSVWEKPLDLKHRGDINRIIEDPPHKRKLEAAANKSVSSCPGDENDDLSIKIKRNKTEDSQAADQAEAEVEEQKAKASGHQITPPLEERITHFRDMLLERGVSAFSTWEKELHKIVFDPRYLLLNSEERKQIFEQFVKTRIREEYKEKKNKLLLAKEEFKKLLEESKLSPRTTFKEFAEKYGRDQRFRLVQKKKDQEHFFNQFILILKKRDKENRIRLRKMR
ncbi:Transcription elongation regulator 1-like protein [Aix galericulata]|nr:Transcription elongation regulator 1-like protein [Aix galericulata]